MCVGNMDRRERRVPWWHTAGDLQREGKLHAPGRGCARRFELRLLGNVGSIHTCFSYSNRRETSKGMWVREDTETLKCFENPKYLPLKDMFVLKP